MRAVQFLTVFALVPVGIIAGCSAHNETSPTTVSTVPVAQAPLPLTPGNLVATANPPNVAPVSMAAIPADLNRVTGPVDGVYRGIVSLVSVSAPANDCPGDARGVIEIGDRLLQFAYTTSAIFNAVVPPGGELHAQSGAYKLDGRLADGQLTAIISGPACKSELAFGRVPYF